MSSVIYYRFRSSKTPQRLTFDGTGISIFDVKRGILLAQKLNTTADSFQLTLTNPDTHEEYTDDSEVLPRSTLVEAKRLPLARAGGYGAASHYVSGSLTINAKNASRRENFRGAGATSALGDEPEILNTAAGGGSEQDMMNMMFAQQGAQWSQTQQEMATKTKVYTARPTGPTEPDKTLPPGYICHRCGQKGHWINNCPSLYDRSWETKKVLRTTGIPKSMLRTVSNGAMNNGNGADGDDGRSYLMNAEGEYVVAVADDKSWEAFQARQLQSQAKAQRPVPEELQDPITHELMQDPRKMPCCGRTYSDDSIETALIQTDFKCPNCGREDVYIDQLQIDKDMQAKVKEFQAKDDVKTAAVPNPEESGEKESHRGEEEEKEDEEGEEEEDDDDDYSPLAPKRKRRRGSTASVNSDSSNASDTSNTSAVTLENTKSGETNTKLGTQTPAPPAMNPMMMPFMFNPFMMAMMNPQASQAVDEAYDSDYEVGDERPVVGRIR